MKITPVIVILFSIIVTSSVVGAQVAPTFENLGPAVFYYYNPNSEEIIIYNPTNEETYQNSVSLNFSVARIGLFGQFDNIGYSLDGGNITSVNDFINKTIDYNPSIPADYIYADYVYNTTVFASIVLPQLTEGVHNVTVYFGVQYLGTPNNPSLQRFEVFSYASLNFTLVENDTSLSNITLIIVTTIPIVVVLAIIVVMYKIKKDKAKTISANELPQLSQETLTKVSKECLIAKLL